MGGLPISLPPSGSGHGVALLYLLAITLTSVGTWFAARYTARAPLQTALNDAFRTLTEELQEERAHLIVRVSELDRQLAEKDQEVLLLRGEIRGLKQLRDSLIALITRSGIEIPTEMTKHYDP